MQGFLRRINEYFQLILKSEFEELTAELMLSDIEKDIFRLRYVDKMNSEDIADALNIKHNEVKNKLFIMRKKLSKLPIFSGQEFNPDTASEYAMRDKCRKLSKSKDYADFCVDAFCLKLSNKNLAEKYNYTLETVKKYKTIKRKELSN